MGVAKSSAVVAGGALGGGGGTVGVGYGIHEGTKSTIEDVMGEDLLGNENNDQEWTKLGEKVKKNNDKDYGLGALFKSGSVSKDDICNWCKEQRKGSHGSFLYQDKKYVFKVRSYCIYAISEKLSADTSIKVLQVNNTNDDSDFKNNFNTLKNTTDDSKGKIDDNSELKAIKDKPNSTEDSKTAGGNELKKWCKTSLKKGYVKEDQNLYKLTKAFCTKANGR